MNGRLRTLLTMGFCLTLGTTAAVAPARPADGKPPTPSQGAEKKPVPVFADVMVLLATNDGKGIDPRARDLGELKRPPFSSFDSYAVLQEARLPLRESAASKLDLPNGRVLVTTLLERLGPGTIRLSAAINKPNGKDFLPLLEVKAELGQRFIVAGQSHAGGTLVLVIRPTS